MYSLSNMLIIGTINGFGTDTVAAYTSFNKMDGLYWMIIGAFGVAITTFAGQNFGAGRIDRVKKSVRVCLAMAMIGSLLISALLLTCGRFIIQLFSTDPRVQSIGMHVLFRLAPFYFTFTTVEILAGALRGCGDVFTPAILTLLGVCVLRVLWVLVIVPIYGQLDVLLMAYPITWSATSLLFILYYRKSHWLERRLNASSAPQRA